MTNRIFVTGLVVAGLMPAIAAIGFGAYAAMGCEGGGSSGPVLGCHLLGVEFNLIAGLAAPAFVASFFTIPLGVVICLVGLLATAMFGKREGKGPGVYGADGKMLPLPEASAAIAQFDRAECDKLLRALGKKPGAPHESLLLLQARCIQVLISKGAYAS